MLIVVHIPVEGVATLEGGPPISREPLERLAVGAEYLTATHSEDAIRNGRRQRTPPPAVRCYLQNRDRYGGFPTVGPAGQFKGVATDERIEGSKHGHLRCRQVSSLSAR